jgi:hypothetical protein
MVGSLACSSSCVRSCVGFVQSASQRAVNLLRKIAEGATRCPCHGGGGAAIHAAGCASRLSSSKAAAARCRRERA